MAMATQPGIGPIVRDRINGNGDSTWDRVNSGDSTCACHSTWDRINGNGDSTWDRANSVPLNPCMPLLNLGPDQWQPQHPHPGLVTVRAIWAHRNK